MDKEKWEKLYGIVEETGIVSEEDLEDEEEVAEGEWENIDGCI